MKPWSEKEWSGGDKLGGIRALYSVVKSINVFITAVMGCGKGWWGVRLCSGGVCSDAPRFSESLGLCLLQEGEGDRKQRGLVWRRKDEYLILGGGGSLPSFFQGVPWLLWGTELWQSHL